MLEDGQTRCFLEEVPKDTLVLGRFKTEDTGGAATPPATPGIQFAGRPHLPPQVPNPNQAQGQSGLGIKVIASDPSGSHVLQRVMGSEGRFAFTSQAAGEHKMCFQTNTTTGWFGQKRKLKFHLDIETGESATDYEDIAKQEHLNALEVEVRKLNDRIKDIRAEQNYQRTREAVFRDTSESTNSRVVWWSVIQTCILVGAGLWQIRHLKNFFKTKKLV